MHFCEFFLAVQITNSVKKLFIERAVYFNFLFFDTLASLPSTEKAIHNVSSLRCYFRLSTVYTNLWAKKHFSLVVEQCNFFDSSDNWQTRNCTRKHFRTVQMSSSVSYKI